MFRRCIILGLLVISAFALAACSNDPKLKTTSEESYKESLQAVFQAQESENKRLEISQAIFFVITDGQDADVGNNSGKAYNGYNLAKSTRYEDRLMQLDGKTAGEILKIGFEARKKWVTAELPSKIEEIKKDISQLQSKKEFLAEVAKLKENALLDNIKLKVIESINQSTGKPRGIVDYFIISFDAINNSPLTLTAYEVFVTITDAQKNTTIVSDKYKKVQFKDPIKPETTGEGNLEIGENSRQAPFNDNRYEVKIRLANVCYKKDSDPDDIFFSTYQCTSQSSKFSEYDEQKLKGLNEKLSKLEAELKKYNQ